MLAKLLSLDERAKQLTEQAERHDARIGDVLNRLSGKRVNSKDNYVALEAELPRLIAEQPKLQARARAEQSVLSAFKVYLDRLDDNAVLDVIEIQPSADLAATRARITELMAERKSILNAPPRAERDGRRGACLGSRGRRAGNPSRLLTDNAFSPRWGGGVYVDASDQPLSALAFMCWLSPVAARFQQSLRQVRARCRS